MSDNTTDNANIDNQEVVDNKEVDKKSNKSFTQSEFDSALSNQKKEFEAKLAEFEDLKTKYTEIEEQKKAKELEEMTELEKHQKMVDELKTQTEALQADRDRLNLEVMKNKVLSDTKYSVLPRMYKNGITGDSEEALTVEADKVLEEYKQDMDLRGVAINTPNPNIKKHDAISETTPKTPAEKAKLIFKKKAEERLNGF
jgi:hypothetical protein